MLIKSTARCFINKQHNSPFLTFMARMHHRHINIRRALSSYNTKGGTLAAGSKLARQSVEI